MSGEGDRVGGVTPSPAGREPSAPAMPVRILPTTARICLPFEGVEAPRERWTWETGKLGQRCPCGRDLAGEIVCVEAQRDRRLCLYCSSHIGLQKVAKESRRRPPRQLELVPASTSACGWSAQGCQR